MRLRGSISGSGKSPAGLLAEQQECCASDAFRVRRQPRARRKCAMRRCWGSDGRCVLSGEMDWRYLKHLILVEYRTFADSSPQIQYVSSSSVLKEGNGTFTSSTWTYQPPPHVGSFSPFKKIIIEHIKHKQCKQAHTINTQASQINTNLFNSENLYFFISKKFQWIFRNFNFFLQCFELGEVVKKHLYSSFSPGTFPGLVLFHHRNYKLNLVMLFLSPLKKISDVIVVVVVAFQIQNGMLFEMDKEAVRRWGADLVSPLCRGPFEMQPVWFVVGIRCNWAPL